jgi:hypothetical protein
LSEVLSDIDEKAEQLENWALGNLKSLAGEKVRKNRQIVLGLNYPGATGERQWLHLTFSLLAFKKKRGRWLPDLSTIKVKALETASVAQPDLMRRTAHVSEHLAAKTVLIFGLGAIGSTVAVLLAEAGLPTIYASDADYLRPGNCVRHAAGLVYVGFRKTIAVKAVVEQHAPYCSFILLPEFWNPGVLEEAVGKADIVIDATASESFSFLINEICQRAGKPAVYVATFRKASIGRVRVVRPGQSACPVCYHAGYNRSTTYPFISPGDEGEFIEGGCGDPTVEASAIDISLTASVAAKAVVRLILGSGEGNDEYLIVNETIAGNSPLDSVGIHALSCRSIPGCEACARNQADQ